MSTTQTVPQRSLWIFVIGIAVLFTIGVALAVMREPERFDPGTPEAAVQAYVVDILDGDTIAATEWLTVELREGCRSGDLGRVARGDSLDVVLRDVTIRGDVAIVDVDVTENRLDSPLGIGTNSYGAVFGLERGADAWLISDAPWPFFDCPLGTTP